MEILVYVAAVIIITLLINNLRQQRQQARAYSYHAKQMIMTPTEGLFFERLTNMAGDRFFIMPQAHLSTFIDHKVRNGQSWKAAFSVINAKSVDFLLVEKLTLKPFLAIELDDNTHKREDRVLRDARVKAIIEGAGIPLVRFANINISDDEIFDTIDQIINTDKQDANH